RSAFDHSMNYRSVVAFGTAQKVVDSEEKIKCLRIISEHVIAGRWSEVRFPSDKELKATAVLEFSIEEASSKVRTGPPVDNESDYGLPVWAGVLPLEVQCQSPIPDDRLDKDVTLPDYVRLYNARLNRRSDRACGKPRAPRKFFTWRMFIAMIVLFITEMLLGGVSAKAQQTVPLAASDSRQSLDNAWGTGPLLAPSPATLPRDNFLIEPSLYDVTTAHSSGFGSLTQVQLKSNFGILLVMRDSPLGIAREHQSRRQLRSSLSTNQRPQSAHIWKCFREASDLGRRDAHASCEPFAQSRV
ncbi:MAG TPA: pyridoxamine 5'-phosphate oxidase family protein, partial [Candidatus Sulfotelmatobacter sp.]|nr:pyridoxamine 5'-phosphate oxidase family protein [Candidatus Sulfotelmatobacter sp.]